MMSTDPLHIRALMIARLTHTISPEEEQYLDRLMEDEAIQKEWAALQAKFSITDINEGFSRFDKEEEWLTIDEITALPSQKKRTTKILRYTAIAAALVAGLLVGFYFLKAGQQFNKAQNLAITADNNQNGKDIVLRLANGQVVNLSEQKDSIQTGMALLNNTGKTLSYKSAAASNSVNSLVVPVGKDYHLVLSDGTEVWLNSATRLDFSFAFTGKTREITISGEAYLKVAQNASQPFIIHTPQGNVQVLGTAFNINSYDSGTVKVSLVEGAIRYQNGQQAVTLQPGTEAVDKKNKKIQIRTFDQDEVLSWKEGKYYFSDAGLPEILSVLPRWYGIEVVVDNPNLQTEVFTGGMDRNKPVTFFLDNLQKTMNLQYSFDSKGLLHIK